MLGLDPTVEPKNGHGIVRHTVIRPGSEMEELDSQYTTVPIQLETREENIEPWYCNTHTH